MLTNATRQQLKNALKTSPADFGGADDTGDEAQAVLAKANAASRRILYGASGMVIALFAVMLVLLVSNRDNPTALTIISGFTGITLSGLIWLMIRIAREMAQTTLLLELFNKIPDRDAVKIIRILLNDQSPQRQT